MKFKSDAQRKAVFANLNKSGKKCYSDKQRRAYHATDGFKKPLKN